MEMGYELLTLELCIKRRTEIYNGCQCLPFASGVRLAVCFSVFVAAWKLLGKPADEASDVIKIPAVVIIAFNFTAKAEHKRTVRQTKILSNFTESVHQYRIVS